MTRSDKGKKANLYCDTEQKASAQRPKGVATVGPVWEEVRAQLAVVLSSGVDEHPPPFDAASDVPIDQQKYEL